MSARRVGTVTVAAGAGSVVGSAAAQVIVWALALIPVDASPIEGALGTLLAAAGAVYGGYLVPGGGNGRRVAGDDE